MKNLLLLFVVLLVSFSCSKKVGLTTSKIKFFSGSISAATAISAKANNGLLFYGNSNDGKTFVFKVDAETSEFAFPNGVWNFYAVSWYNPTVNSETVFMGKVYCAKSVGVNLTGVDATVELELSNENCLDSAFSKNTYNDGSNNRFPGRRFVTCRDVTTASGTSSTCDRSASNRGYATYMKVRAPSFKNFGSEIEDATIAYESGCIKIDESSTGGVSSTSVTSPIINPMSLNLPDPINGLGFTLKTYFTKTACDEEQVASADELVIPLNDTPRTKTFLETSGDAYYVTFFQANESQLCLGPRMSGSLFAGGFGTSAAPYAICNEAQYNLIGSLITDSSIPTQHANIELAADLDFKLTSPNLIGSTSGTNIFGGNSSSDYTYFEGNNHRISNVFVSPSGNYVGLIPYANYLKILNLTVNKILVSGSGYYVGGIVGYGNGVSFNNVKVFGHIEGYQYVGGLLGRSGTENLTIANSHFYGDVKATATTVDSFAGGFVGSGQINTMDIYKSSVKGSIKASCNTSCSAYYSAGGFFGELDINSPTSLTIEDSIAKTNVESATWAGGLIGFTSYASTGTLSIANSYVTGSVVTTNASQGVTGGLIGQANTTVSLANVYALVAQKNVSTGSGGLVGVGTSITCPSGFCYYFNDGVAVSTSGVNVVTNKKTYADLVTALSSPGGEWRSTSGGLPQLNFEQDVKDVVPYLGDTTCDGHYSTLAGTGSTKNPYLICSPSQFINIASSSFSYEIKNDLFFDSALTMFDSGTYRINGLGNTLYNIKFNYSLAPTSSEGLFKKLSTDSYIQNINFSNLSGSISSTSNFDTTNMSDYYFGLIAGENKGTITNLNIDRSFNYFEVPIVGTNVVSIGGIVGLNEGLLSGVDANITFKNMTYGIGTTGTASGTVWGGVAAKNSGTIEKVKSTGEMSIMHGSLPYYGMHTVGGIVSENTNTGILSQITTEGSLSYIGESTYYSGHSKFSPLAVSNQGKMVDIDYGASLMMYFSDTNGVIYNNLAGGVGRLFFRPSYITYNFTVSFPTTGTLGESFCYYPIGAANCYQTIYYDFIDGLFSVSGTLYSGSNSGNLPINSNNWKMTNNYFTNTNYNWYIDTSSGPEVMANRGSFEKMGVGF